MTKLLELLIPFFPLYHLQYDFLIGESLLEGRWEMKNFPGPLNMYCVFIETYWSIIEDILKLYWRVLNADLAVNSNVYYSDIVNCVKVLHFSKPNHA